MAAQENKKHMGYFKKLAERGREYLKQLEKERRAFIRAQNKQSNQQQIELFKKLLKETSSERENNTDPEW